MRSPLVAGVRGARRTIHTSTIRRDSELGGLKVSMPLCFLLVLLTCPLKDLMAQFQNPSSPFHIAPGSSGPASPDDRTSSQALPSSSSTSSSPSGPSRTEEGEQLYAVGKQAGMDFFRKDGWDTRGILEWPFAWGDCDMFQ